MKIWSSTAGWRLSRTYAELLFGCALLLLAVANAPAKEKAKEEAPNMEMLEFLGTYETADGKIIDPLKFADQRGAYKSPDYQGEKKGTAKKPDRKKRDENDE